MIIIKKTIITTVKLLNNLKVTYSTLRLPGLSEVNISQSS